VFFLKQGYMHVGNPILSQTSSKYFEQIFFDKIFGGNIFEIKTSIPFLHSIAIVKIDLVCFAYLSDYYIHTESICSRAEKRITIMKRKARKCSCRTDPRSLFVSIHTG
jgi:hypothetical protein